MVESPPSDQAAAATGGSDRPARVVIVGGGYGGAYCAAKLERLLGRRIRPETTPTIAPRSNAPLSGNAVEVILLDRNNYFIFYPLLVEAGTGSLEPRHAVVSIRSFLKRTTFHMVNVTGIDFAGKIVRYHLGDDPPLERAGEEPRSDEPILELPYDHLVLSPGSVTMLPAVPGLREHGFEVKSLGDAVGLRDRAIRLLELADAASDAAARRALLHFVVVGASFTGAEVAGEFHEFLHRVARKYPNLDPRDCTVTLIEKSDRILRALSEDLSRYAERRMRERGIDIRLNETVSEVGRDFVVLGSGERLPAATTIWCAGIAPSPLVARLDLPVDERGYILCERDCRVRGFDNVWAIGDSAVNIDTDGNAYPATAQHAVREGVHVAKNIVAVLGGENAKPLEYATQGTLAALGCRTGVAEVLGITLSGFPAWWLWRTVYLLKMPGLGRKMRVALDWTLDLFFKRDDVQLGVLKPPARPGG